MLTVGASCSATALGKLRAAAAQADLPGTDRRHPNRSAIRRSRIRRAVLPGAEGQTTWSLGAALPPSPKRHIFSHISPGTGSKADFQTAKKLKTFGEK
jgi:hypothetical protein